MREVEPEVFLVAQTMLMNVGLAEYQRARGIKEWSPWGATSDAECLAEIGGRMSYRSWEVGLNPNIKQVRTDKSEYLQNILKQGHGSVLEHSSVTFIFHNVSRVFTHELVRHRVGVAISQESMRYVRYTDIPMMLPSILHTIPDLVASLMDIIEATEKVLKKVDEYFENPQSEPRIGRGRFRFKKNLTSALRRFLPHGIATDIMWTANFRALRHVLELRTAKDAEEEIRLVFDKVGHILQDRFPMVFGDFHRNDEGEWTTPDSKV